MMTARAAGNDDKFPYFVEIWTADGNAVERTLARSLSIRVARAMYQASLEENADRRITLRCGEETLSDSGAGGVS